MQEYRSFNGMRVNCLFFSMLLIASFSIGFAHAQSATKDLSIAEKYPESVLTESDNFGDGFFTGASLLDEEGIKLFYIKKSGDSGIYNLETGENLILPNVEFGSQAVWNTNENDFALLHEGLCLNAYNHSEISDCIFQNTHNIFGFQNQPLIHENSRLCNVLDQSVSPYGCTTTQGQNTGKEWDYFTCCDVVVTSESKTLSFGISKITMDKNMGSDDVDVVAGFFNNQNWEIQYNDSYHASGISFAETFFHLEGDRHADIVSVKWIPNQDSLLVLYEDRISIYYNEFGWGEKDSIALACYDGEDGGYDNNQLDHSIEQANQRNYGFVTSHDGRHVVGYDECNGVYALQIGSESSMSASSINGIGYNDLLPILLLCTVFSIVRYSVPCVRKLQPNFRKLSKSTIFPLFVSCLLLSGCTAIGDILSTDEETDYHFLDLVEPNIVSISEQPFSDEYIATVTLSEETYLDPIDYYMWDGENHIWGSLGQTSGSTFNIPGACVDSTCFDTLQLFWTGNSII